MEGFLAHLLGSEHSFSQRDGADVKSIATLGIEHVAGAQCRTWVEGLQRLLRSMSLV